MKIVVCIKQVPNTTEIKIDPKTGTMIREGIDTIINPDDKNAIEAALEIKEKSKGAKITVISMGPPQAEDALREALAMGCDRAILISDRHFAGSDTAATSYILSQAVKKLGKVDLVICGRQAIDGDTAQTGPQMAELLSMPQVTYVSEIKLGDMDNIMVKRALENGYESIRTGLPALITVIGELNKPRYPTLSGITNAMEQDIEKWDNDKLEASRDRIGLKGSPTQVKRSFSPPAKGQCKFLKGSVDELAQNLVTMLKEKEIVKEF